MIIKHVIENVAISSFFMFLFSNFMWIEYNKEIKAHRASVGLIFGFLGIVLMFFPIVGGKIPLDMRALSVVLPCIVFGATEVFVAASVVLLGMLVFNHSEAASSLLQMRYIISSGLCFVIGLIKVRKIYKIILTMIITTGVIALYYIFLDRYNFFPMGATHANKVVNLVGTHLIVSSISFGICTYVIRITRGQAKLRMELKNANQELRKLVEIDDLTGVYNRRTFNRKIEETWHNFDNTGLIMIDIDYFKQYNDTYGHVAGDECLRKVAQTLTRSVRATDIVARYGGEEFAIILTQVDHDEVLNVAERIRKGVNNLESEHIKSPIGRITVSAGAAIRYPNSQNNYTELIMEADENLYRAKTNGRNQVKISGIIPLTL